MNNLKQKYMENNNYNPKFKGTWVTDKCAEFIINQFSWFSYKFPNKIYINKHSCDFNKGDILFANTYGSYSLIVKGIYPAKGQKRKNQMLVKLERVKNE